MESDFNQKAVALYRVYSLRACLNDLPKAMVPQVRSLASEATNELYALIQKECGYTMDDVVARNDGSLSRVDGFAIQDGQSSLSVCLRSLNADGTPGESTAWLSVFAKLDRVDQADLQSKLASLEDVEGNPWDLYESRPGWGVASKAVSEAVAMAKSMQNLDEAWREVEPVLVQYSDFGANDTASREVISANLEGHFERTEPRNRPRG